MGRGQACDGKQEVPAKTAQWAQVTLKVRGWPALDRNSRPGQARPAHTPSEGDYGQRNWEIKAEAWQGFASLQFLLCQQATF